MTEKVRHNSTAEFLKLVSGKTHSVTVDKQIFRKITFENIKILDDTDYLSHGEFIFHVIVNNVSMGRSKVIYAHTGETIPYKWSVAVKHSIAEPLLIEFKVDELERLSANNKIMRFSKSFLNDSNFGIENEVSKKYSIENEYIAMDYVVEKMIQDEFQKMVLVGGTVKSEGDDKPIKDASIKIFKFLNNELFNETKTDGNGAYQIDGLNVEEKYRLEIKAKGYAHVSHIIEDFPNIINSVMTKLFIKCRVVNKNNNDRVKDARVDLYKALVKISQHINCYIKPDKKSEKLGQLEEGDYPIIEFNQNGDTEYVKVQSDKIENGEGWICLRTQKYHYGLVFNQREKENIVKTSPEGEFSIDVDEEQLYMARVVLKDYFDAESKWIIPIGSDIIKMIPTDKSVMESAIIDRLNDFKNFTYNLDDASYPYTLPDVNIQIAPPNPKQNNCCTFVEGLLVKAWKDAQGSEFNWSSEKHKKMMIQSTTDYYSPVTAIIESNMGIEINENELPPPWTIVQGWKSQWSGGHTFIIVDVHKSTQRILTLESNSSYKMNGPGFRQLGDIDKFADCNPGKNWWKNAALWDWGKFKEVYLFRRMARLKIYDLKWVK